MPRNGIGARNSGGNRTDVPAPAAKQAGQPNGRPPAAMVPDGLPYGEKGQLQAQIKAGPKFRGRPMPPPPTSVDLTQGPAPGQLHPALQAALDSRGPRPPVPGLFDPPDNPNEDIMSGAITRPDSVVGVQGPGSISATLQQVAMMTGSAGLAALATHLESAGN